MDLLLHIGMPKTGSTATQVWLKENQATLAAAGIGLCPGLGQPQNANLSLSCMDPDQEPARFHVETVAPDHAGLDALRAETLHAFGQDIARARAAGLGTVVISDENCFHLDTPERVARAHAILSKAFSEIRVVVWLRPQVETRLSDASNQTRIGRRVDRSFFDIDPSTVLYDYDRILLAWEEVFGSARVTALPYSRVKDVTRHIAGLLGLEPEVPRPIPRTNTAVGVGVMAMVNQISGTEMFTHALFRGRSQALSDLLAAAPNRRPLRIGRAYAAELQARFAETNAKLVARHATLEEADLELDLDRFEVEDDFALLEATTAFAPDLKSFVEGLYLQGQVERLQSVLLATELALQISGRVRINMSVQDPRSFDVYAKQAAQLITFLAAEAPDHPRLPGFRARLRDVERALGA